MGINLVQHRSDPSIWDRTETAGWDTERWLASGLGGALILNGLRHRSPAGLMATLLGVTLAWWAMSSSDTRGQRWARMRAAMPGRDRRDVDPVIEASEESFPASDPPSWTPSTGSIGPSSTLRAQ